MIAFILLTTNAVQSLSPVPVNCRIWKLQVGQERKKILEVHLDTVTSKNQQEGGKTGHRISRD